MEKNLIGVTMKPEEAKFKAKLKGEVKKLTGEQRLEIAKQVLIEAKCKESNLLLASKYNSVISKLDHYNFDDIELEDTKC